MLLSHRKPKNGKLKAANFRASKLKIGTREMISKRDGHLVTKCYYTKKKLVWEILEGALKSKIEIQWLNIVGIRATIGKIEVGILEFEVMAPKPQKTGIVVGLNKGHVVTRKELVPRPSNRKMKTSKRIHLVKNVIREVAGLAPYEKRITKLLKLGKDKRALKLAKRKLGTHKRTTKKRDETSSVLHKMRNNQELASLLYSTRYTRICSNQFPRGA